MGCGKKQFYCTEQSRAFTLQSRFGQEAQGFGPGLGFRPGWSCQSASFWRAVGSRTPVQRVPNPRGESHRAHLKVRPGIDHQEVRSPVAGVTPADYCADPGVQRCKQCGAKPNGGEFRAFLLSRLHGERGGASFQGLTLRLFIDPPRPVRWRQIPATMPRPVQQRIFGHLESEGQVGLQSEDPSDAARRSLREATGLRHASACSVRRMRRKGLRSRAPGLSIC